MIPLKYRASKKNIEETIKTGISVYGDFLYAKISKINREKPDFAVVVTKKTEKTSVGRHLTKRRIRSVLEENLTKIKKDFNKTIVVFAKKTEKPLTYEALKDDLEGILKKAGVRI